MRALFLWPSVAPALAWLGDHIVRTRTQAAQVLAPATSRVRFWGAHSITIRALGIQRWGFASWKNGGEGMQAPLLRKLMGCILGQALYVVGWL